MQKGSAWLVTGCTTARRHVHVWACGTWVSTDTLPSPTGSFGFQEVSMLKDRGSKMCTSLVIKSRIPFRTVVPSNVKSARVEGIFCPSYYPELTALLLLCVRSKVGPYGGATWPPGLEALPSSSAVHLIGVPGVKSRA